MSEKKIVPDTSVVIDGRITEMLKEKRFQGVHIILPRAVLAELEHQANIGKETGEAGLSEIQALVQEAKYGRIKLSYAGERPSLDKILGARGGDIDAMIRDIAKRNEAILLTSDHVQKEVALAEGIEVIYLKPQVVRKKPKLSFLKYFSKDTLSVHLKEGTVPLAKVGRPGRIEVRQIGDEKLTLEELRAMAKEIVETARRGRSAEAFVEIDRKGATVVQLREYRCAIARPPFSDGFEITIVRPLLKVSLEQYPLSAKLKERLSEEAEGVIVCGPPGAGKSTFTAALAEFYLSKKKIVKTMESPRDLQVVDEITQYAPLEGSFERTSDVLLLVRPDYTIYDEMRKTDDFRIYTDMRMAGVGMVGVVHANRPIDAIQRFIGRIELGVIPQIVDTVIFIKDGEIRKVYELDFSVKVPHGMREEDLARPVIEIKDFETGIVEYEIYKFGEETVVLPIKKGRRSLREDASRLKSLIARRIRGPFNIEFLGERKVLLYLRPRDIARFIGKRGKKLQKLEKRTGYTFEIRELR